MKVIKTPWFFFAASLAFHLFLFAPWSSDEDSKKEAQVVRSVFKIDRVQINPQNSGPSQKSKRKGGAKDGAKEKAKDKANAPSKNSLKGRQTALKNAYLTNIRQRIIERQRYPFAARKLNLKSATYHLAIQIAPSGDFDFKMSSANGHALFDQAVKNLFKELGRFDPPPESVLQASTAEGLIVELVLEFVAN